MFLTVHWLLPHSFIIIRWHSSRVVCALSSQQEGPGCFSVGSLYVLPVPVKVFSGSAVSPTTKTFTIGQYLCECDCRTTDKNYPMAISGVVFTCMDSHVCSLTGTVLTK